MLQCVIVCCSALQSVQRTHREVLSCVVLCRIAQDSTNACECVRQVYVCFALAQFANRKCAREPIQRDSIFAQGNIATSHPLTDVGERQCLVIFCAVVDLLVCLLVQLQRLPLVPFQDHGRGK